MSDHTDNILILLDDCDGAEVYTDKRRSPVNVSGKNSSCGRGPGRTSRGADQHIASMYSHPYARNRSHFTANKRLHSGAMESSSSTPLQSTTHVSAVKSLPTSTQSSTTDRSQTTTEAGELRKSPPLSHRPSASNGSEADEVISQTAKIQKITSTNDPRDQNYSTLSENSRFTEVAHEPITLQTRHDILGIVEKDNHFHL